MNFVKVARVLIVNQLRAYRVHKFVIVSDLLIFLSVLSMIFILKDKEFVIEIYRNVTAFVNFETLKRVISSLVSALVFLGAARMRGRIIVFKDQYPIFMYPVSVTDFLLGRLMFDTFNLLRFSLPLFFTFYLLTFISGSFFSAILAYAIFILGLIYLSMISFTLNILGARALLYILAVLSLLDLLTGKITASLLFYIVINAIHSCYTSFNPTSFLLAFVITLLFFLIASSRAKIDVEEFQTSPKLEVRSEIVDGILRKTIIDLKRSKVFYSIFLILPSLLAGSLVAKVFSFSIPGFVPVYIALFAVTLMEYYAMQEAAILWLYRVTNSVDVFAKSIILKTFLSGSLAISPVIAFFLPLLKSPYIVVLLLSFVSVLSVVCSLAAVKFASKARFSLKFIGMAESRAAAESFSLLFFLSIFLATVIFGVIIFFLGNFAFLLILAPLLGVKMVENFAKEVNLK